MKSFVTPKFWSAYANLPEPIRRAARKQFRLWMQNRQHPSVQFKPCGAVWSARVTQSYRALAIIENGSCYWIWIGAHDEYESLIAHL